MNTTPMRGDKIKPLKVEAKPITVYRNPPTVQLIMIAKRYWIPNFLKHQFFLRTVWLPFSVDDTIPLGARASFQRNAGLFAIAREGCLSGLQRGS